MKHLFTIALFFLIIHCTLSAQTSFGSLKITIVDNSIYNLPVPNVQIKLFVKDTILVATGKTDTNGIAFFEELINGDLKIEACANRLKDIKNSTIKKGEITSEVITLRTRKKLGTKQKCSFKKGRVKPKCHICNSRQNVIPYVYGYPSPETSQKAQKQEFMLGGCTKFPCRPKWYCKKDNTNVLKR